MPQTRSQIQQLLRDAELHPRHRFGQNFMVEVDLVRRIVDAATISNDDLIVEVGPGTGTLTEEILTRGARVLAVEIDRDLARLLRERFATDERFGLIEGDALDGKHALNPALVERLRAHAGPRRLIANLPYNIASPLIVELLIEGVSELVFTVQKEVGQRLLATPGSDAYGPLTVIVQSLGVVEILRTIGPGAFWPAPKIDSALVRIRRSEARLPDPRGFSRFVQGLMAYRRKTLRRAWAQAGHDPARLADAGVDDSIRADELEVQTLRRLHAVAAG